MVNGPDPLTPGPALLCKLGSIIRHAQEMASPGGHSLDLEAMLAVADDPEVSEWLAGMDQLGLLPVRR